MRCSGSMTLPLVFDIFFTNLFDHGMKINGREWWFAHKLASHHHHSRNPKEEDVKPVSMTVFG